jgi:cell division protein FtsB
VGLFSRHSSADDDTVPTDTTDDERRWFRRRGVVLTGLAVLVVIIAFGCWLGFQGLTAKNNLEQARSNAQQTKDALLQGNTADASRFAADAQSHAQTARDATHSLPWNIASAVPWLGSPFKTGQQIADVVLGLTADVLKPTADAGTTVAPNQLLANGRLDVQALRKEEPGLSKIAADAARLNEQAQAISEPSFISALGDARSQLQAQTSDLAKLLGNTALAARVAPSLMGADGPRTYFLGFQTNAEARGTGGLLGGFGILRFDNGKPSVDSLGPNTELDKRFAPMSLGPDYDQQYGFTNPTTDYRNSNQSPHFPYAAQIWKSMWEQQSGMVVDGVVAIDPIALSYILGATGPIVMPDGETVTENNVVELTESTVYNRYPTDQKARKQYLVDIATEVVKKITKPVESPRKLIDALGRAASERRIAVWSSSPADQKLLEQTPLAHEVPDDPAPFAAIVINNLGGNKMDYYLNRQIEYVADGCDGDTRMSTVTVRLTNTLTDPSPLPEYVAGKLGFFPDLSRNIPRGAMLTSVRLLATKDAQLISAVVNGKRIRVFGATELGHPSYEAQVAIDPGKTAELTFRLSEPTAPGEARVPVQPLIDNVTPKVSVPTCTG